MTAEVNVSFTNELGNEITMKLVEDDQGVTVHATGPTSTVEHTWTPREAAALQWMLSEARVERHGKFPKRNRHA